MRYVFREADEAVSAARVRIRTACRSDETDAVRQLLVEAALPAAEAGRAEHLARELVAHVRSARRTAGGIDAFLHAYDLSTWDGVALMCLAEALLRIPDPATAERLIRDKIGGADWQRHLGDSDSLLLNASTWGLMLTGRIVGPDPDWADGAGRLIGRLVSRLDEPVIREAMIHAMRIVGQQFVMGRTIEETLARARKARVPGERYSFDMLGEAARTADDAARYLDAYRLAIDRVGKAAAADGSLAGPGVSVRLSALHPRFEAVQRERVLRELVPRFVDLAERARTVRDSGRRTGRLPGARRRSPRGEHGRGRGDRGSRSRQDSCRRSRGGARGGGFLQPLRGSGARGIRRAGRSSGVHRRNQLHRAARPRRRSAIRETGRP